MERASGSLNVPSPLTPITILHAKTITSTIAYLHAKGFIHRDLKPQNILLVNGQPKISDFETSKIISNTTTITTMNPFTPKYAAVEVFDHAAVQASDVYSLGVILYELLLNQIAFENSTQTSILLEKLRGVSLPFRKETPQCLQNIITKCLENDPIQRPSIEEILEVLNKLQNELEFGENLVIEPKFGNSSVDQDKYNENFMLKQQLATLERKNQELLEANQKQKEYINKMDDCFIQINQKIKDLNRNKTKLESEKNQEIEQLIVENRDLNVKLQNFESKMINLNDGVLELDRLKKDIAQLRHKYRNLKGDFQNSIQTNAEQKQELDKLNEEKNGLIDEFNQKNRENGEKLELLESLFSNINFNILPRRLKTAINSQEHRVYLVDQNLSQGQVASIAACLNGNQHFKELNLENNNIDDKGAFALAQALKTNTSLEELYLYHNKITQNGCKALADALVVNSTLRKLGLLNNPIGDLGIQYLAHALEFNNSLAILDLGITNCGNEGAIVMSEALKMNSGIKQLHLRNNNIDDQGAEALAQAMMVNVGIELWLSGNTLSESTKRKLKQRCNYRIRLQM
ncbi:hypothetical protein P9112_009529 [Eukaryota sp. TZLM1-RC]